MWSIRQVSRPISRPSAAFSPVRLRLEALDLRLPPSSLLDPPDDLVLAPPPAATELSCEFDSLPPGTEQSSQNFLPVQQVNGAPQIINFQGVEVVRGMWRFTGDVIDESPGGLIVTFGGEPVSLQNVAAPTDATGHFDKTVLLRTDGSDTGTATARTVDVQGRGLERRPLLRQPGLMFGHQPSARPEALMELTGSTLVGPPRNGAYRNPEYGPADSGR